MASVWEPDYTCESCGWHGRPSFTENKEVKFNPETGALAVTRQWQPLCPRCYAYVKPIVTFGEQTKETAP